MKRLLLVRVYQEAPHPAYSQPLGIMYLASYLRERRPEVEVKLLDMRLTRMAPEGLRAEIAAFKPDCVGLSVLSFEAATLPACARVVKEYDHGVAVIVGGPHASSDSETILRDENVDLCVIGEGEETLLELVDKGLGAESLGEVAGVAYRAPDGAYARNAARDYIEGVDDLPFPAWDMIDVLAYSDIQSMNNMLARSPYMAIFTSRACPYRCAYCHEVFGKTFRARSVENVIAEMRHVYDVYGVREFHIVDDIFNWDPDRAGAIMDAIVEAGMDVKIAFPNGVRADRMTPELVRKFARAGTYAMSVAVETASPRLQGVIEKHNDLDKVRRTINEAYKAGIIVKGFFMLGFPTETPEEIEATIDFAVKSRCLISGFFTVVPFPGSTLYD
ncbi:MAG: B12-binding domain-containing radical SAM protein, partial [Candidatus Methylomirabilis sp.]|nr:B12-binding domain-containing radical SAM protein [Deltaproteobacteria bacterium]